MANTSPVSITLPPDELRKLDSLMKEMQKTTGAELSKVLRNTAVDFCIIAQRKTPSATARSTRWRRIPTSYRKKKDGTTIHLPLGKMGKGSSKGLAKAGWSGCLSILGKKRTRLLASGERSIIPDGKMARIGSHVKKRHKQFKNPYILVRNQIPFIEDLDRGNYKKGKGTGTPKHILQRSLQELNLTLERRLSNMAKRTIRKTIGGII